MYTLFECLIAKNKYHSYQIIVEAPKNDDLLDFLPASSVQALKDLHQNILGDLNK